MFLERRDVLAALAATAVVGPAAAQAAYPERPIRMIIAFAPGGPTDAKPDGYTLLFSASTMAMAKGLAIELVNDSHPVSAEKFYDGRMAFWDPIIKASGATPE